MSLSIDSTANMDPAQRSGSLRARWRASAWHLAGSATLAVGAALLVFLLWYPGPYRWLSGGQSLFLLLTGVDLVLGPLMTLVIFNIRKPRRELLRDVTIIVVLQLGGLLYGLHTVYLVRPVALVFEISRFRVVPANQVALDELPKAPPAFRQLSLRGPLVLGVRRPGQGDESYDAIIKALGGTDLGQRPSYWVPYADVRVQVLRKARPLSVLLQHDAKAAAVVQPLLAQHRLAPDAVRFVPVIARARAVALVDARGDVVGFAPINGFF
jgi:hypothetical protein